MPVVARADKGIGQCVENARCLSSRALVEVTWILVQKRGQNCSANHNAGKAVCSGDSIPLTVPLGTLLEVWAVCRLAYAGYDAYAKGGYRISRDFHCKLEFKFGSERLGMAIVINIEVRDNAQDALLFLHGDLLGSNLYRRVMHINAGLHFFKPEFAARQEFVLAWLKHDSG